MKKRLQVYITPEADALLRKKAKTDHRSISSTIEMLIVDAASYRFPTLNKKIIIKPVEIGDGNEDHG